MYVAVIQQQQKFPNWFARYSATRSERYYMTYVIFISYARGIFVENSILVI